MARNKGIWLLAIYFFLAVYLLPMFPHGGSANELTRWATAASLVENHSFEISWTEDLIGINVDTATVDGRIYSNKAPGTAIIAAPFYAVARAFTGPPNASNIRVTWFVMRFALSSLPLLLLGIWLYRKEVDETALAILLFASPLFVYSLLFFSHVLVAVIVYFAFRLIYDKRLILPASCLPAGALSGLAVICEFPALFAVAAIGGGLLFTPKRDRLNCIFYFVIGGLPFAVFLLIYNYALFGSAFSMSYAHESFPEWAGVAGQGVFGIGVPSLSNAFLLLFSPSRGLFFTAPILILSVAEFFSSSFTLRRGVRIAAIGISVIILSGHGAAHGGWAFGPRYLIFVLPFLLDPFFDGELYEYSNVWQGALFAISFVFCVLPSLTFPFAPPEFAYPHNSFWMTFLISEKWFAPNLANVFGANSAFWNVVPVLLCFTS
ncbi:MAG TPA: hypothetical protein VK468_09800, partial [Pyrinomonadaceae bacterium]|nr:hypothetical protein [Pyrinomonadaceae bacterium]